MAGELVFNKDLGQLELGLVRVKPPRYVTSLFECPVLHILADFLYYSTALLIRYFASSQSTPILPSMQSDVHESN